MRPGEAAILTRDIKGLYVRSPYNAHFVEGARQLRGRWDGGLRTWTFTHQQEEAVRKLMIESFGYDEDPSDGDGDEDWGPPIRDWGDL